MRCKNCGYENDDKLYICENCGSPLYDENEPVVSDSTQVFNAGEINEAITPDTANQPPAKEEQTDNEANKKKTQLTVIIAVLVVVLIALIVGIVFAATHNKKDDTTTLPSTTVSTTVNETTTQAESTTESTTAKSFALGLSSNAGGSVSGDGIYNLGDNVTVNAVVEEGYTFDGWYNGDTKVSSNTSYTFTITNNTSLKAIFKIAETTTEQTTIEVEITPGVDN